MTLKLFLNLIFRRENIRVKFAKCDIKSLVLYRLTENL